MPLESVFMRLFQKDTVNSLARRISNNSIADSLDLVLSSVYNHEKDLFVNKFETLLQMDNAKHNPIKEKLYNEMIQKERNDIQHPLVIGKICDTLEMKLIVTFRKKKLLGGLHERRSPHSVKLVCIGQHTPITNAGYSRQPLDGNIFKY